MTSQTLKMAPKWSIININGYKTPGNDTFDLKFGMGMFFVTKTPIMKSKFQNFGFFAYFVTSQILKMTPKWLKININVYKTRKIEIWVGARSGC